MIEKISKDCKIELCGLLAHSTVEAQGPGGASNCCHVRTCHV